MCARLVKPHRLNNGLLHSLQVSVQECSRAHDRYQVARHEHKCCSDCYLLFKTLPALDTERESNTTYVVGRQNLTPVRQAAIWRTLFKNTLPSKAPFMKLHVEHDDTQF